MSIPTDPPPPRVLPVRYPPPPPPGGGGGGVGRVLLILLLLASLAVNVILVCGGVWIRAVASPEAADVAVRERFFAGNSSASDKVAVVRIEGAIMEGLLGYAHKQIEEAAR